MLPRLARGACRWPRSGSTVVVVVAAFASTSRDITSAGERILTALAERYPDAQDLPE
ncbi:hypothetical protein [Amycolatopsis sp. YIM 10]|uniref:hypothetical protein n=1 Tax=Amycolatopsis sp. YIM 10 TaxID=2653857 RepID=UPI00129029A2|nr:hypothetical protein [Amycolatopsis sp. YIM 10]